MLRIRPGFPMSDHVLRGKGKPFPYNEAAADSPDVALVFGAAARRAGVGAPYKEILRFRRKNVNGDGECEEKDKCPENLDAPLFLRAFCVRLCGMDVLFDSCGFQMSQKNRLR